MSKAKLAALLLSLLLASALHIDWHLARPAHYGLSLAWPYHWVATGILFGLTGWLIARKWPALRWRLGAVVFLAAILLAQGVEPLLEVLLDEGRLGYEVEPARWSALGRALGAATPAYWIAIWLGARGTPTLRTS